MDQVRKLGYSGATMSVLGIIMSFTSLIIRKGESFAFDELFFDGILLVFIGSLLIVIFSRQPRKT